MKEDIFEFVRYAYNCVPVYYEYAKKNNINIRDILEKKDFDGIPLINKRIYFENCEEGIAVPYCNGIEEKNVIVTQTSGTTGECMNIFWKVESMNKSMMSLWIARKKRFGISTNSKVCSFYLLNSPEKQYMKDGIIFQYSNNHLSFFKKGLTEEKLKKIYAFISEYKPEWMILQPSMAMMLMDVIKKNKLKKIDTIKYIEFTGEYLEDNVRNDISKFFECKVANQYGCTESNSIAFECECGNLHCMENNSYVEIIKDGKRVPDGEWGEIYITSIINDVMPFIRYSVGDYGRLISSDNCKCKKKAKILELKKTRTADWIYHIDGTKSSAYDIIDSVEKLNRRMPLVKQYQIVQPEYNELHINLVMGDFYNNQKKITESQIAKVLMSEVKKTNLLNFEFKVMFYDELYPQNDGKFKNFVPLSKEKIRSTYE